MSVERMARAARPFISKAWSYDGVPLCMKKGAPCAPGLAPEFGSNALELQTVNTNGAHNVPACHPKHCTRTVEPCLSLHIYNCDIIFSYQAPSSCLNRASYEKRHAVRAIFWHQIWFQRAGTTICQHKWRAQRGRLPPETLHPHVGIVHVWA